MKDTKQFKFEHAYSHILGVVESEIGDRTANANYENHLYLPYAKNRNFYGEYVHVCQVYNYPERASESVFNRALTKVITTKAKEGVQVRLSGGKGGFDKCDICHNADLLLKRSHGWSDEEKAIIHAYRRQHIAQQFAERVKLQSNIANTYKLDHNGQPKSALIFGDGMTVYTGNLHYTCDTCGTAIIFDKFITYIYIYKLFL
jgi:hypothetical protein